MAKSGNRLIHRSDGNDKNKSTRTGFHPFVRTLIAKGKTVIALTLSRKIALDVVNDVKTQN